jgi:hypothetical protein
VKSLSLKARSLSLWARCFSHLASSLTRGKRRLYLAAKYLSPGRGVYLLGKTLISWDEIFISWGEMFISWGDEFNSSDEMFISWGEIFTSSGEVFIS